MPSQARPILVCRVSIRAFRVFGSFVIGKELSGAIVFVLRTVETNQPGRTKRSGKPESDADCDVLTHSTEHPERIACVLAY
jgi:hypothetical protein